MAQTISDHQRAVRIAHAAGGALSETMLQREIGQMDPAAVRLARAHDVYGADGSVGTTQTWPGRPDARQPLTGGRHGTALDGARDLDCLTEAVYFEARGEAPRGQAAVAQVVMNRLANPNFPKTVCGVVFQGAATHGCQFSFACDGSMRHGLEADAWDKARKVAERALSGVALAAGIGNATHFHALGVQPLWGAQMLRVAQVGLHVFYRVNPHAPVARPEAAGVMTAALPMSPAANLRLAGAVLEKTAEVTTASGGPLTAPLAVQAAESKTAEAKAAPHLNVPPAAASADRAGEPVADRAPAGDS
ncbi:MAG: cell wall hydrolase [Proteobacteria bacterium]|nr:cell wall hydrolase [Pseudomonadota bacterium]